MAEQLITGALPKSRAGRQATPINEDLVKALVKHFSSNPFTKDDEGNDRPNFGGPATEFDTQGKAASQGRRYAERVGKDLGDKVVRVSVATNGKNAKDERFLWRLYIPVSEMPSENGS